MTAYAKRLHEENSPQDVCGVLKRFEVAPRQEFENAMPDIGTILEAVQVERRSRLLREQTAGEERLVRWRCPVCRATGCGFVRAGSDLTRYCRGIPQKKHYTPGERCGMNLEVISNLPAGVASGR